MKLLFSCPPTSAEYYFVLAGDKEEGTSPKKGKLDFKVLYFVTEEMYAPLSWVMSKQPRDNAFLKASFYTLIDNVTD